MVEADEKYQNIIEKGIECSDSDDPPPRRVNGRLDHGTITNNRPPAGGVVVLD